MYSPNGKRARRGISITAVLGVVAILALSGLALGHGRHGGDHRHGGPDTGTIASFDNETGVLAIQLTGGDTVSGLVTRRTRIKCEDEHSSDDSRVRGREAEPGDDRGGHGNEPGDDNGGDNSGPGSGSGPSGHDDNGTGANCTTADLIAGATVHEAELDLRNGKALFREVELAE
jgi:hypothetical protein